MAFEDDVQETGVQFARRDLGGADVCRRVDGRDAGRDVFGRSDLRSGAGTSANGLYGEAMCQRHIVPDLVELCLGKLQSRRVDAVAIAEAHEPSDLVDGEKRLHPVAQALRHIARILGKCLRRVG